MYGREYNLERAAREIPKIPDDWQPVVEAGKTDWYNPNVRNMVHISFPTHRLKQVLYSSGVLRSEIDFYVSGSVYRDPDAGILNQSMSIEYNYDSERNGKDPWLCHVMGGTDAGFHSLKDAERILKKWGIDR